MLLLILMKVPAVLAAVAMLAIAGWYALTVPVNYQGNWTALFCTGDRMPVPPELAEGTYRFQNSYGYDGQFYRLVARDPVLTRGFVRYSDAPALRWRRILVPGIAWTLAFGRPGLIDGAYVFTVVLFCGLGVYALSRWLRQRSRHPAGGLLFLLLPGTLVSIDRMTVDAALYALMLLCLLWDEEGRDVRLWIGLACCALTRDLGFVVAGAFCVAEISARRFRRALLLGSSILPACLWYAYLRAALAPMPGRPVTPEIASWAFSQSGYGIFLRMLHPAAYDLPAPIRALALTLDQVALTGLVAAVIATLVLFRWRSASKLAWIGLLFALLYFAASDEVFWGDLFSWVRAYTPLLLSLALARADALWRWAPLAAVSLRVLLQFGGQIQGVTTTFVK